MEALIGALVELITVGLGVAGDLITGWLWGLVGLALL